MINLIYSKMTPNEQRTRLQGIAHVFYGFDYELLYFLMKFWFSFWGFIEFFEPYGIKYLKESAIDFVLSFIEAIQCLDC